MKKTAIVLSVIVLLGLTACDNEPAVHRALDTQETRNDIYKTIANDSEMMAEFMEVVQHNTHASMMMEGMGYMHPDSMNSQNIMNMMSIYMDDSTACEHLTDSMLVHRTTMYMMLDKMHNQGMMDENCLEEVKDKVEGETVPQYDFGKVRHWH